MLTRDRKPALGCGADECLSPVEMGWRWEKKVKKSASKKDANQRAKG